MHQRCEERRASDRGSRTSRIAALAPRDQVSTPLSSSKISPGICAPGFEGVPLKQKGASFVFRVPMDLRDLAPSGKGLPLPGMPAKYASIITGLPRIAAIRGRPH
jgi:hypothetical protein